MTVEPHTYRALSPSGELVEVSGWRYGDTGLAYHEVIFPDGETYRQAYPHIERYIVNHLLSGHAVLRHQWLYTHAQAEAFLERIAGLVPWNEGKSALEGRPRGELVSLVDALYTHYYDVLCRLPRFKEETIGRALVLLAQHLGVEEREGRRDSRAFPDAYREEILAYAQAPVRLRVARELTQKHGRG